MPLASNTSAAGPVSSPTSSAEMTCASKERMTPAAASSSRPPWASPATIGPSTTGIPGSWRRSTGGVGSPRRLVTAPIGELVIDW